MYICLVTTEVIVSAIYDSAASVFVVIYVNCYENLTAAQGFKLHTSYSLSTKPSFPANSLCVGVHRRKYRNIKCSLCYATFDSPFIINSTLTRVHLGHQS